MKTTILVPEPLKKIVTTPHEIIISKMLYSIDRHVWVTARNKQISVREMSTSHIKNCVNCFNDVGNMIIPEDYLGGRIKWLKIFDEELVSRN